MRTQRKCFSQDTKACPDPRSLHCAHMSRATCCVTPPLTLPRHVIRPWAHFSLQCVPRRLTKLSDSWSHPEHSMWSFYDIREVKGHDHFSSTISHILEKWNSCRSFYLLYCSVLWSLLILNTVIAFLWGSRSFTYRSPQPATKHDKLVRKLTEQFFLMETFTGLKIVLWHPQQHRPS